MYTNGVAISNNNNNNTVPHTSKNPYYQNGYSTKIENGVHRMKIVWRNVVLFIFLHIGAVYGFYLLVTEAQWKTVIYTYCMYLCGELGITAGAHRLWTHRSYKAKLPLRIILMVFQTIAFQNHIYEWVRDHRVHHKFTDSNADPHNATRGFFFCHMGWLMVKKHPDVFIKGKTIDLTDLTADPVVRFQKTFYLPLVVTVSFVIPTFIPWCVWGESLNVAWYTATLFRYAVTLNCTWLVNSAAHMWGTKPYDKTINPSENPLVSFLASGEGWHNYHHVFPWDYKAAELSYNLNFTTAVIDFFSIIGWAYDMKTVTSEIIQNRINRTGNGRKMHGKERYEINEYNHDDKAVWGWDDSDLKIEDKNCAEIYYKLEK